MIKGFSFFVLSSEIDLKLPFDNGLLFIDDETKTIIGLTSEVSNLLRIPSEFNFYQLLNDGYKIFLKNFFPDLDDTRLEDLILGNKQTLKVLIDFNLEK